MSEFERLQRELGYRYRIDLMYESKIYKTKHGLIKALKNIPCDEIELVFDMFDRKPVEMESVPCIPPEPSSGQCFVRRGRIKCKKWGRHRK